MADLKLIKQLRESTGCVIADCNKALAERKNNIEEAYFELDLSNNLFFLKMIDENKEVNTIKLF